MATVFDLDDEGVSTSRPMASWDQVVDQLGVMLRQEGQYNASFRNQEELFEKASSAERFDCISWDEATMIRRRMCEWSFHVVDYFGCNRDVVGVALNLVDRYAIELLKDATDTDNTDTDRSSMDRKGYQSIFVVSLYVAIKLQGSSSRSDVVASTWNSTKRSPSPAYVINIRVFADLSRGLLTVESLEKEELSLVSKLQFRLNPPTAGLFNEYFTLFLMPQNPFLEVASIPEDVLSHIFEVAKYHTELSTFDVTLTSQCRPSCVAAASILNALDYLRQRMGEVKIPPGVADAFESNALSTAPGDPDETTDEINKARKCLRQLCPAESLDAWPGGWNDPHNQRMEEPPKDQIVEDATGEEAPKSPTGVNSDITTI